MSEEDAVIIKQLRRNTFLVLGARALHKKGIVVKMGLGQRRQVIHSYSITVASSLVT